jgi:hypothetical protein
MDDASCKDKFVNKGIKQLKPLNYYKSFEYGV